MLLQTDGFLSGESVGETLGISRAAVGNAVRGLREEGYDIEAVTNRGFRLVYAPDRLNRGALLAWLDVERMERVVCLESVDSTNRHLAQMALDGAPDGTVAVASAQSAGRGRLSRAFYSPAGMGVYFSYLIRPGLQGAGELQPASWTRVTSMTAVAVSDAVEEVCGKRPAIKWVNDLYLGGKKICGILTQMDVEPDTGHVRSIVIGIGVNVLQQKGDFPEELRTVAGSLHMATGQTPSRARLAACMTRAMDAMRGAMPDTAGVYLQKYRDASLLPGTAVTVIAGDTRKRARALAIEDDYALRVRYEDGTEESLRGGEVTIRREKKA